MSGQCRVVFVHLPKGYIGWCSQNFGGGLVVQPGEGGENRRAGMCPHMGVFFFKNSLQLGVSHAKNTLQVSIESNFHYIWHRNAN